MKNTMTTKNNLLFASLLLSAIGVHAHDMHSHDTGGYVGGEIATNSVTTEGYIFVSAYPTSRYQKFSEKASATAFGIYGGYNFTNWFGLESAFTVTNLSKGTNGNSTNGAAVASFSLTPKVTVRTSDSLSIYAKAGVAVTALCDENYNSDCWSGTPGTAGFGLQFDLSHHAKLRFGYDVTKGSLTYKAKNSYSYSHSYYQENIDLTQKRVSVSMHYQF